MRSPWLMNSFGVDGGTSHRKVAPLCTVLAERTCRYSDSWMRSERPNYLQTPAVPQGGTSRSEKAAPWHALGAMAEWMRSLCIEGWKRSKAIPGMPQHSRNSSVPESTELMMWSHRVSVPAHSQKTGIVPVWHCRRRQLMT